jgi:hypothetical protein
MHTENKKALNKVARQIDLDRNTKEVAQNIRLINRKKKC